MSYYLSRSLVLAGEDIAEALHVEPGMVLLSFDELGYNDENNPILHTNSYFVTICCASGSSVASYKPYSGQVEERHGGTDQQN